MYPEYYSSPEVTDLAKALIAVQHTLQPAIKDRENPFAKSRYATLNSVMDSCRDALLTNGIWVTQSRFRPRPSTSASSPSSRTRNPASGSHRCW